MSQSEPLGRQVSFCELFGEFRHVQIPIIQRDYAQGRRGEEDVRTEFLSALKAALDKPDTTAPLDLDFVYGSSFKSEGAREDDSFAPLDGQQRLTTLFLLHWYLAWADGEEDDFQERFSHEHESLFAYEVRPSSRDFFNRLSGRFPEASLDAVNSLRAHIEDQPWFFTAWQHDPTIESALNVMEAIHQRFGNCVGYYARLTGEQARIKFQLLELKNFGLSDDLYIKMNSRGKPLTHFETFKARLEKHLEELLPGERRSLDGVERPVKDYFGHCMDTKWADVFWDRRNRSTNLYDDKVMRLVNAVALVCLEPNAAAEDAVKALRAKSQTSFSRYLELDCLNRRMLNTMMDVLDYWSACELGRATPGVAYVGPQELDEVVRRELKYPELVMFAAFCRHLSRHGAGAVPSLDRWMRVVGNLVENTDIERPAEFVDALKSLNQLEGAMDEILQHLATGADISFFNRQQVREERIKAALLLRNETWVELVWEAEKHPYFAGQIEFLLEFSGLLDHWLANGEQLVLSGSEESEAQGCFRDYWQKANAVFGVNGLRPLEEYRWERALLCLGDYTLSFSRNLSLLGGRSGKGPTWKTLLRAPWTIPGVEAKRDLLRDLLSRIDLGVGVAQSLDAVIATSTPSQDWRRMLVELPEAVACCHQRMLRLTDRWGVYLISKLRTASRHWELWSLHLQETTLQPLELAGDLRPFVAGYQSECGEEFQPRALLKWHEKSLTIDVDFHDGFYRLLIPAQNDVAQRLAALLEDGGAELEGGEDVRVLRVLVGEVESAVRDLVRLAREIAEEG